MNTTTPPQFVVIDDDLLNVRITQKQIEKFFPESAVKTFRDPVDGLEYIESVGGEADDPTIVLLDIRMPRLNGWEFIEAFVQLPAAVKQRFKVCMFSSSISSVDRQKANEIPEVYRFIEKPIPQSELELLHLEFGQNPMPMPTSPISATF